MKTGRIFLLLSYRKGNIARPKRKVKVGLYLTFLFASFFPNIKKVKRWPKNGKPNQPNINRDRF